MTIINKTPHGQIFRCGKCNAIHIEFKNLNFNLSQRQLDQFTRYLNNLNGPEWEQRNTLSNYKRKIIIPTQDSNFNFLLNNEELKELIMLLKKKKIRKTSSATRQQLFLFKNLN